MRRVFVMALALLLPACAEVQTGTAEAERTVARVSPDGPISIIYRDDESNERILNGVASYDSVLGRDRAVYFTVKNQSAEPVCDGTFTVRHRQYCSVRPDARVPLVVTPRRATPRHFAPAKSAPRTAPTINRQSQNLTHLARVLRSGVTHLPAAG
jgi:hypothetical protein